MKIKPYILSDLRCPVCNTVIQIPRFKNSLRPKNHIKTMYCWKCKEERDFLEMKL